MGGHCGRFYDIVGESCMCGDSDSERAGSLMVEVRACGEFWWVRESLVEKRLGDVWRIQGRERLVELD